MSARIAGSLMALLLLAGLRASPAAASDLTGEWRGKVRCKAYDGVRRSVPDRGAIVKIRQTGRRFVAQLEDAQGLRRYNGETISQIVRSQRVEAILMECRSTAALSNYSEKVMLRGNVLPTGGRLAGQSFFRNQWGEIGTCRWRLQRVDHRAPTVAPCS